MGSIDAPFVPGSFVTTGRSSGLRHIGLIDHVTLTDTGALSGEGRVLGSIDADGNLTTSRASPFFETALLKATADEIESVYQAAGATLGVGTLVETPEIEAKLIPSRFNRHTFWCGQSGSGKTYALGVVLEQLLIHTALPMVIFDPNADFVRLRDLRSDSQTDAHRALRGRDIRVLRPGGQGPEALRARFRDFSMQSRAAVLRLDPIVDRDEYNVLTRVTGDKDIDREGILPALRANDDPAADLLIKRVENLRMADWTVWAHGGADVNTVLDERPDATVLDIGGFAYHPGEKLVIALAVLDDLWAKREARRPILIVIDEAHNLCSPDNDSPLHRAVRERIIQIAAEGRKFGLWLLLSTQRPSKIHPSILSQCDNLALMRMSSPVDLTELAPVFGFVPRQCSPVRPDFNRVKPSSPAASCRRRLCSRFKTVSPTRAAQTWACPCVDVPTHRLTWGQPTCDGHRRR